MEGVWAPMQKPSELYDDPQAIANGYLPEVIHAEGTTFRSSPAPVQFDEAVAEPARAPPSTASTPRRSSSSSAWTGTDPGPQGGRRHPVTTRRRAMDKICVNMELGVG